ncbi:hypothetical protein BV25DRAFT_1911526 [Artomyces pyxidatus]|uniref:Uncharacterized protein n=1 Tax=Artomyces pyxidatus TaxID=48021 RepID=A0ACB8TGR1_9AGAM|nr:hypothetical protein BV25DRAFT_1911526 [Artomyces pyxidatus]
MATRYIPELIYSLALSSLSVHLLFQRRESTTVRRQLSARVSLLEELVRRLRAGEDVSPAEIARMRKLGREGPEKVDVQGDGDAVGWREVIFGRAERPGEQAGKDEWERKDLERAHREIVGSQHDGSTSQSRH